MEITVIAGAAQESTAQKALSQSSLQRAGTMCRVTIQHTFDEPHSFIGGRVVVKLAVQ